ncbi:MAG: FxsA family protein [Arenicella sp.]
MRYLFILFLLVPIAEMTLLIKVGGVIGAFWTILLVVFTAVLGAALVKSQGYSTLNSVQTQLSQGGMPAMEVAEGAAILIAGALLLTPGFFTDAIGFACLTPPIRRGAIKYLFKNGIIKNFSFGTAQGHGNYNTDNSSVIEGEYRESQESKEKGN